MILDHYTIHCAELARSRWFYTQVLGMTEGYRPPFEGPEGAWMYGPSNTPLVHLYAGRSDGLKSTGGLDHIAFRVGDIADIVERLERHDIEFDSAEVPELGSRQVFFRDPDGIQVELTYEPSKSST